MRTHENILISSLTTMRIGGPARYVVEIEKPAEIPEVCRLAERMGLPIFVLGEGANTIGHDEGFDGMIMINRMRGISEENTEGTEIKVMGGELWDTVVEYACSKGLTGIEALSKIPGLAGAAPVQNIGAYGQEVADTLVSINAFDMVKGTYVTLKKADLQFAYRKSILNTTEVGRYFVISINLRMRYGTMARPFYSSIEKYIAENGITDLSPQGIRKIVSAIRADKLPDPLVQPSAGSFFKNIYLSRNEAEVAKDKGYPVYEGRDGYKINSGWFIEQCGLAGKVLHGFRVNEKAALVLINESAKTYKELAEARGEIVNKVYDKFGYWLEQEPVEIMSLGPVNGPVESLVE